MNLNNFIKHCWKFYRALEDDFMKISRYVTLEESNKDCHSIEFSKQYQSICSEIDVVCKLYCELIDPNGKYGNIFGYAYKILDSNPSIVNAEVVCDNFTLKPWEEWKCDPEDYKNGKNPNNISPKWWKLYNKVKHERLREDDFGKPYYRQANLMNTINSLAALYVLEMNMFKKIAMLEDDFVTKPSDESVIFTYKDWETHIHHLDNGFILQEY